MWTVVVAGGGGARFGAAKQYALIDDRRVIDHAVGVAAAAGDGVVIVVPADDVIAESARIAGGGERLVVAGGATRSESVRAGLAAVPAAATIICVHDAARPFATPALFAAVVATIVSGADAAIPGLPVTDTIKVVDTAGRVVSTPDRATLVAVQTPQAFRSSVLRKAHAGGGDGTDDAGLVERTGGTVVVVSGEADNRKVTHPDDLVWARARAGGR